MQRYRTVRVGLAAKSRIAGAAPSSGNASCVASTTAARLGWTGSGAGSAAGGWGNNTGDGWGDVPDAPKAPAAFRAQSQATIDATRASSRYNRQTIQNVDDEVDEVDPTDDVGSDYGDRISDDGRGEVRAPPPDGDQYDIGDAEAVAESRFAADAMRDAPEGVFSSGFDENEPGAKPTWDDVEGGYGEAGSSSEAAAASEAAMQAEETDAAVGPPATSVDPEYAQLPIDDLVLMVCSYLRAAENVRMVSAAEEALLFPAVLSRIDECSVEQLLDIVDSNWTYQTNSRYGIVFKDLVRDRIITEAEDLPVELLQRCIVVLGMSVGKRKRDLDLFQYLGRLLVRNINGIKDPHMLVEVLTAFARARIVPPNSFLALMGRRFPVLNKRNPLGTLPAYRAFVNLYKMGHDQMNPFRFLADQVMDKTQECIVAERKEIRARMPSPAAPSGEASGEGQEQKSTGEAPATGLSTAAAKRAALPEVNYEVSADGADARRRFVALCGLKPIMFNKLLLILARFGAPHQTYLRPLSKPLLVPTIPHMRPPSFTRIVRAVRLFQTTERPLIQAILDHMVNLGPERVVIHDLFDMLRVIAHPDTPPVQIEKFMQLAYEVFSDETRLRAKEMVAVAGDLLLLTRKEDDFPVPVLEKLVGLVEQFAKRMTFLLELKVLSLQHAEMLEEIAKQLNITEDSEALAELKRTRRQINQDGDDEYYSALDIDVREVFFRTQLLNAINTFGAFRPLPAKALWDYKKMLTTKRVDYVVEAAHLFARSYPRQLLPAIRRVIGSSVVAKITEAGEPSIELDGEIQMVYSEDITLTMTVEEFRGFTTKLAELPLKRVQQSRAVWEKLQNQAIIMETPDVRELAEKKLEAIGAREAERKAVLATEELAILDTPGADDPNDTFTLPSASKQ